MADLKQRCFFETANYNRIMQYALIIIHYSFTNYPLNLQQFYNDTSQLNR
jgi:hypothetical protein